MWFTENLIIMPKCPKPVTIQYSPTGDGRTGCSSQVLLTETRTTIDLQMIFYQLHNYIWTIHTSFIGLGLPTVVVAGVGCIDLLPALRLLDMCSQHER